MLRRKNYMQLLDRFKNKHVIKVATGIRRAGKSSVFLLYIEHLKKSGVDEKNIIFLNLEDLENAELLDYKNLYNFIKSKVSENQKFYIFIDEIQRCAHFEKVLDSLFLHENLDLYVAGSNAYFLSGELATLLSGRYVTIHIQPLSFSEYLEFCGKDDSVSDSEKKLLFNDYIRKGQFPYIPFIKDDEQVYKSYIEGIFNTILVKDVATRAKINDVSLLIRIVKIMCSNIGSQISVKRITDTLISSGRKISGNTVELYIKALCDAFIFYEVPRFDIKGNEILKSLGKYYLADTSFKNFLLGSSSSIDDFGHILENIVYLELIRRGNTVFVGKNGDKEVDFVAKNGSEISYFQVSASVLDDATRRRELEAFKNIKDNFPKYLLTLDDYDFGSLSGVIQKNIIRWLLE